MDHPTPAAVSCALMERTTPTTACHVTSDTVSYSDSPRRRSSSVARHPSAPPVVGPPPPRAPTSLTGAAPAQTTQNLNANLAAIAAINPPPCAACTTPDLHQRLSPSSRSATTVAGPADSRAGQPGRMGSHIYLLFPYSWLVRRTNPENVVPSMIDSGVDCRGSNLILLYSY
jgi:hypothetical protein